MERGDTGIGPAYHSSRPAWVPNSVNGQPSQFTAFDSVSGSRFIRSSVLAQGSLGNLLKKRTPTPLKNFSHSRMSGNHTPPVFPYGYYPSSSYIQSRAPAYAWSFPGSQPPLQPSYGAQVNPEAVPGLPENPAGSSTAAGDPTNTGKVKISRHTVPGNPVASGRVSRACEPCREQKAKCSGHQPVCQRCEESGIRCSYGDRKREKLARQVLSITTYCLSLSNRAVMSGS